MEAKLYKPEELTKESIEKLVKDIENEEKNADIKGTRDFASQSNILIQNPNQNYLVDLAITYPFRFMPPQMDAIDPGVSMKYTSFSVIFMAFRQIKVDPKIILHNLSSMATLRVFHLDASQDVQYHQLTIAPQATDEIWLGPKDQALVVPSHFHSRVLYSLRSLMEKLP